LGKRSSSIGVGWLFRSILVLTFLVSATPVDAESTTTAAQRALAAPDARSGSSITGLPSSESPMDNYRVTQEDRNGDGRPDLTIIDTVYRSEHDQVRVYDGAGDMQVSSEWDKATDFLNDTWLYDTFADGSAQLIIKFSTSGDLVKAELYEDVTGDRNVAYEVTQAGVFVLESEFPSLVATTNQNWLRADGSFNWNLTLQADGSAYQLGPDLPRHFRDLLKLDGEPDTEMEFRDTNDDGVPEYGLWRVLAPSPARWGFSRTGLFVNLGQRKPRLHQEYMFWPLLSNAYTEFDPSPNAVRRRTFDYNYFDFPPVIQVNWFNGRIERAFIPGYPIEEGYHVNALKYFTKGEVNIADFENAMAYYDLAADSDGYPELHIRLLHQEEADQNRDNLPVPVNEIRWSWVQQAQGGLVWDYKLGLAGRHALDQIVDFPDFSYRTIPYRELPTWVMNRDWDYGTFVARESDLQRSAEGIYQWAPVETLEFDALGYLSGRVVANLDKAFLEMPFGWRGEFAPEMHSKPYVYFSPIDRKLHLVGSERGIWNLDNFAEIHYRDQDRDSFLDEWRFLEGGVLSQELHHDPKSGYLIYASDGEVLIKQASVSPSLFTTQPPQSNDEWLAFEKQLEEHQRKIVPGNFKAMLEQFSGPLTRIDSASIRDYRPTAEGFRFVLVLDEGFSATGEGPGDLLDGLTADSYLVTYEEGSFAVELLSPARPRIREGSIRSDTPTPLALHHLKVSVTLENIGREDRLALPVRAFARPKGSDSPQLLEQQVVDLLGSSESQLQFIWAPPRPGVWEVYFDVGEGLFATAPIELNVVTQAPPPSQWLIGETGDIPGVTPIVLLAVALAGVSAPLLLLLLRSPWREEG
jgi:hypothetical protein